LQPALREQLQNIYSSWIDYLSRLSRRSKITAQSTAVLAQEHQRELFIDYTEAQKWLGMLIVYYPIKLDKRFNEFRNAVMEFSTAELPDLERAKALRNFVILLATADERLQQR
jgi:hypothetical protein